MIAEVFTVRLELDTRAGDPVKVGEQLAGYGPEVGRTLQGRVEVVLTLPGDSLLQAVTSAVGAATVATGFDVLVVEAMPVREFAERLPAPDVPDLLSVTEAADVLRISRQRVLQLIEGGRIPAVKVGSTWAVPRASAEARRGQMATESI